MDIRSKTRKRIIALSTSGLVLLGLWHALPSLANRVLANQPPHVTSDFSSKIKSDSKIKALAQKKNSRAAQHRKTFERDGWTFVEEAKPDSRITSLNPDALTKFESEIQVQLQTNTYEGEMLERVREIARRATDDKTRYVALESLGRSDDPRAQELLIESFDELNGINERRQIIGMLKPNEVGDRVTGFLFTSMARADLSDSLKKQSLGALVAASLAQNLSPNDVLSRLPKSWHAAYQEMMAAAFAESHAH